MLLAFIVFLHQRFGYPSWAQSYRSFKSILESGTRLYTADVVVFCFFIRARLTCMFGFPSLKRHISLPGDSIVFQCLISMLEEISALGIEKHIYCEYGGSVFPFSERTYWRGLKSLIPRFPLSITVWCGRFGCPQKAGHAVDKIIRREILVFWCVLEWPARLSRTSKLTTQHNIFILCSL